MTEMQNHPLNGLWLRVAAAAAIGLGLGVAAWLIGTAGGAHPRVALCLAVPTAGAVLLQLVLDSLSEPIPSLIRTEPSSVAVTSQFRELRQLERRLEAGSLDASRFERSVRPALVELMTDRLRHKHGVDLGRQPSKARALLGDELWQLTAAHPKAIGAPAPGPSKAKLSAWVSAIERI